MGWGEEKSRQGEQVSTKALRRDCAWSIWGSQDTSVAGVNCMENMSREVIGELDCVGPYRPP